MEQVAIEVAPDASPLRAGSEPGRRLPGAIVVLLAGLAGLAWGVVARLWMRFISTDPEFTWSGTLFIIFGFGIFGLTQGVALAGRRAGWQRPGLTVARVVGGIGMVPIFGGAGALMLPTVLGGGLAWFRTDWSRWVRGVLVAVACLPPVFLFGSGLSEDGWSVKLVVGTLLLLPLYGVIILATRPTLAPQLDGWRLPRLVRIGLAVVTVGFTGLQVVSILSS
ncbi:MAG TPA: hypothetical protein VF076_08755 [Acidimicrobiales bacterium]